MALERFHRKSAYSSINNRAVGTGGIFMGMKHFFFKFKMTDSKKLSYSTSPKAEQYQPKFQGLVLGLVGLIDAMCIDVAQPIWP